MCAQNGGKYKWKTETICEIGAHFTQYNEVAGVAFAHIIRFLRRMIPLKMKSNENV